MYMPSPSSFRAPVEPMTPSWRQLLGNLSSLQSRHVRSSLPELHPPRPSRPALEPGAETFVCSLDDLPLRFPAIIQDVKGDRSFRRRLMELGLVPGTEVRVINVAPLRDPLEIEVRGCRLSIRRAEARMLQVLANTQLPSSGVEV